MFNKRTGMDYVALVVVVAIAAVVIVLSYHSTEKLALSLGFPPLLTAGMIEMMFASLLFIRSRQRATRKNVPSFLEYGYWISLGFVTMVNIWGLIQISTVHWIIAGIVALAISGSMWLMENVLVWLWVDADKPHVVTVKEQLEKVKRKIKEEKMLQQMEWMMHDAKKPDLRLIKEARRAEEKRKQVLEQGLPEYFHSIYPSGEDIHQLPPANFESPPTVIKMNPIGFHVDYDKRGNKEQAGQENIGNGSSDSNSSSTKGEIETNLEKSPRGDESTPAISNGEQQIQQAMAVARQLMAEGKRLSVDFGRGTLMKKAGVSEHYAKQAIKRLDKEDVEKVG